MPERGLARCHCGAVEIEVDFPSRFCAHCYCYSCRTAHAAGVVSSKGTHRRFCGACGTRMTFESEHGNWAGEVHLPLADFVTPVDREPSMNSFPEERPAWAPFHAFH